MDDQIKIYDTVRGNQFLYYNHHNNNTGYNTTNSTKLKKNSNHWTNIFTWKKKAKQSPNSIMNYPFVPQQKYSSVSAATGIAYTFAPPPPARMTPPAAAVQPLAATYPTPDVDYITATTTTTTTVHASVRHNPGHRHIHNRNSLFYSPWETFHDHSAHNLSQECTCRQSTHNNSQQLVDTYCSQKDIQKSLRGLPSSKSVPMIATIANEPIYESRRLSRMDLYSVDEENNSSGQQQKSNECFKSKSSDSLLDVKKQFNQPLNGLKSSRSSTTLNSNPFAFKSRTKDPSSATVNERFLRFFKKSAADPYNSIASRKSILECDVTAYDLIKQNLELKIFEEEDDIDDSLSDNAIENDAINCCEEVVGNSLKSNSRKSLIVGDSHLNDKSNIIKSNALSEARHTIVANSVRIGGYGMSFGPPPAAAVSAPKYNPPLNKSSVKSYPTIESTISEPSLSSSSWSSDDTSIPVPEPDYDTDDNVDNNNEIYSRTGVVVNSCAQNIYQTTKTVLNSPPLVAKRLKPTKNKPIDELYEKIIIKQSLSSDDEQQCSTLEQQKNNNFDNQYTTENKLEINHKINGLKSRLPSNINTDDPPVPPPEPPISLLQTLPTINLNKGVVPLRPVKLRPVKPNVNPCQQTIQSELKDRLNSGVKSILKKSRIQSNQLTRDLSKSETDLIASTSSGSSQSSDSCDYLRTFKEFKESRLRPKGRHRRVHFKSHSHDRLIIDEISAQTIPEVEESDEPIYDDVRLPGANSGSGSASDDDSNSCGLQQTANQNNNNSNVCQKAEQLNTMSESITSDNRIAKTVTNDNCLTNDSPMGTTVPTKLTTGPVEFAEFDPCEDLLPSTSTTLGLPTQNWKNTTDLKQKQNLLPESQNSFNGTDNKNSNKFNCHKEIANKILTTTTEVMRGPVGSPKNSLASPAVANTTQQSNSIGVELNNCSDDNNLRVPVVQRKYLPVVVSAQSMAANTVPVAKPRDERQQGKNEKTDNCVTPVAQARAHKSLAVSSVMASDKSYLSLNVEKIIETIGEQKSKHSITQTTVQQQVCQEFQSTGNYVQNSCKNSVQLLDINAVRHQKQTLNNSLHNNTVNNNTEIEILDFNRSQSLTTSDNCLLFGSSSSYETQKTLNLSIDECIQNTNKVNPYLCTISIKNGSNNQIINQTSIETNLVNSVCLSGSSSIPFESIGSSNSSSSIYDSGAQSSTDSLTNDRSLKYLNESPITVLCANSDDKIVINVPSDHTFDNINEHIYEELDNESIYVDTDGSLDNVKSIFDGASKDEILEFLEDAKERVGEDILVDTSNIETSIEILEAIDVIEDIDVNPILSASNRIESTVVQSSSRRNRTSNVSNSSTDSTATTTSSSIDIEDDIIKCVITNSSSVGQLVERNDSGVGAETSKPSRHRKLSLNDEVEHQCADCEMHVDPNEDDETGLLHYPLFCHRCDKKRSERKEIISEIVDTEFKYGRDLRIIREEFYRPIEIAGLLSKEQLRGVFINLDELIAVNSKFSEKLQDAIDIATEQGDEDFTTVNIGKLFRESSSMLHAFEVYCVRQGSAALLLNQLEKEKELLRIFLRVSQMENTLLRRMNLRSFLVVPVQRVTKYPLLLNRLYKVTPYHHRDREALRESQQKVELHLEHINQQTKGTIGATTRIWRRISNLSTSHRRLNSADDIGNIKIRKAALEILKWNQEETQFVLIGKVFFTSITDYTVNRKTKTMKFVTASALLVTLGRPNQNYRPDLVNTCEIDKNMVFSRDNTGITDAVLLLIKEKGGRYALCKEILNLKSCVVSTEKESGDEMFEIHEQTSKESLLFKAESVSETKDWLKQLKYHSKDLGNWRRRRNALANIMMVRQ